MNFAFPVLPAAVLRTLVPAALAASALVAVLVGGSLTQPPAALDAGSAVKIAVQMTIDAKLSGLQLPTLAAD